MLPATACAGCTCVGMNGPRSADRREEPPHHLSEGFVSLFVQTQPQASVEKSDILASNRPVERVSTLTNLTLRWYSPADTIRGLKACSQD